MEITLENLIEMKESAAYLGRFTVWEMHPSVFAQIRRIMDADKRYVYPATTPEQILNGDLPPLLGIPVDVKFEYDGIRITSMPPNQARAPISNDPVEHPKHYTSHPSGIECIQITEHMGFNLGNAMKYIWRADLKHDALEDLRKAKWYIEREIAKRGGHRE